METSQAPTSTNVLGEACRDCSIIREADHRIAIHLTLLASYVRLQAREHTRGRRNHPQALHLLTENILSQLGAIARVHRSLATGAERGPSTLREHLQEVCAPLRLLTAGRVELIEDFVGDGVAPEVQILPLTQVVAEWITNALKHAYPDGEPGRIVVRSFFAATGAATIEVIDDGPGLPASFEPSIDGGVGFRLVRALAKQMGARLEIQSRPATPSIDDAGPAGLTMRMVIPASGGWSAGLDIGRS